MPLNDFFYLFVVIKIDRLKLKLTAHDLYSPILYATHRFTSTLFNLYIECMHIAGYRIYGIVFVSISAMAAFNINVFLLFFLHQHPLNIMCFEQNSTGKLLLETYYSYKYLTYITHTCSYIFVVIYTRYYTKSA